MSLRSALRDLVDLSPGDVVEGAVFLEASDEVGLRLRFARAGEPLRVEIAPLEETERHAAATERLAFSYRDEGERQPVDRKAGQRLCAALAARAEPHEAAFFEAVRKLESTRARVREVDVERALEPQGHGDERHYGLSPYAGCTIGCRYCYAQATLATTRRLVQLPEVPWGSYVDVRRNLALVLEAELRTFTPRPIKLCPVLSDPYQPIEKKQRLTRACLEVLAAHEWPVMVLTRATLIHRDLDVLRRIGDLRIGVSLPTIDDDVRRRFEPRAASVAERLDILAAMKHAGIRTMAVVQPILPGDLDALADALAAHADSVSLDVLRGTYGADADFAAYPGSDEGDHQLRRALALRERLVERGVRVWRGELPPGTRDGDS